MHTAADIDEATVRDFGKEWNLYQQGAEHTAELDRVWEAYFSLFPWQALPPTARGFDAGCGSGRWARRVAPRVGTLHCVDASEEALRVARANLGDLHNVTFEHAPIQRARIEPGSMDFGYSLGVLHHVPDTAAAIKACTRLLKPGAPFLLYLYYRFDQRPSWFRALWRAADVARLMIARLPYPIKVGLTAMIAAGAYWPLARVARWRERRGRSIANWPLAYYRNRSFYTMRTDALDRFGTRLEQRFTREEIESMMAAAGLHEIRFADHEPYWCAIGFRN